MVRRQQVGIKPSRRYERILGVLDSLESLTSSRNPRIPLGAMKPLVASGRRVLTPSHWPQCSAHLKYRY